MNLSHRIRSSLILRRVQLALLVLCSAFWTSQASAQAEQLTNTARAVETHVYEIVEVSFSAADRHDNPYLDVDLWVDLEGPNELRYRIPAFWDGGQVFRVRLAATAPGAWHWSTGNKTGDPGLDGKTGRFHAKAWSEEEKQANVNRRGFIRISENGRTMEYADGTPFFYTGDTWWSCLTGVYAWDSTEGQAGISFQDAVRIRKEQGFNGINIISCFPSDLTKPIWHKDVQRKKIAEDGSTPFEMDLNAPDEALAVNYLKIDPGYWQQVDRKMQFFWESGFVPLIETVRRSEVWPEENDAERAAFTNYVRYFWARYGAYNFIFSWLHWDWGKGRNEDYRPMIDAAYAALGDMPYGQPMTAMAAGASDDTWGTGLQVPWLRLHNVSNVGRDARMFGWLRRQYALPDPLPSMNVEPFYPGWNNKAVAPLNDNEMAQFMMYGSVLNGGFGGHAWGDDYYSGVRKFGGDPHVNGFNKWCAASMGHLKDFILDSGHDYRVLAPALDHLVDHQEEFLSLALNPDKSVGLGFISAKMKSSDIRQLEPKKPYSVQWWDIDKGGWTHGTEAMTDATGLLAMPAKPDQRGWAYRILAHGASISIYATPEIPAIQFAANGLQQAFEKRGSPAAIVPISELPEKQERTQFVLGLASDKVLSTRLQAAGGQLPGTLSPEGYAIRLTRQDGKLSVWAIGADATGAMYAGLALAETIARDGIGGIEEATCSPHIAKRGLKINVPLDARTPAYADCGDAAQENMAVMWDLDFWKEHLDAMARHRFNTVTLWNAHPFPSMVKVPEYPDVALNDVMIADIDWREWFPRNAGRGGSRGVTPDILENLKTLKTMSIEEKISFWREVMQHAHDRGIEFHIITWNIFVWGADGKYGITHSVDNKTTVDYLRKSVRSLFETYPLLAGIGVTAGERMPGLTPDQKEQWLWKTYGLGVMDAKKKFPARRIRFIHRYWMSKIPEITKHFDGFDEDVQFDFSYKYVKARLYSQTDPPFVDSILRDAPKGTKWWWNLRNDDIFYFRWGDPDFVREFIRNLPHAEQTQGFHMGSEGYVWGREFVSTDPDTPRQLEIEKHWYRYMLWGRLGYDPSLSNPFFERALQQRFPGKPTKSLQEVWARSSKIIPAVNRAHWHDWDFQWAVESCGGRNGCHAITQKCWKPGGSAAADEIQAHADFVLQELAVLHKADGDKTWRRTLGDLEAMAHLGLYYAEKIRAADDKKARLGQAVAHLEKAAGHWKDYADIGARQYKSQLLSKGGWADWKQGHENARKDIELMGGNPGNQ